MSLETPDIAESIASHAGAQFFGKKLDDFGAAEQGQSILIAGCGSGHEAAWIQQRFQARVEAVDIDDFVPDQLRGRPNLNYQIAGVCDLPFESNHFDLIFYHHVIEHVDRPRESLTELHRVLKPGGWLFIGTPNRHRLVSSVGAHKQSEWESTLSNKIKDNVRDWSDRLRGKFRNELGAHAGFSRRELDGMLADLFQDRRWVTEDYLKFKYQNHRLKPLIDISTMPPVSWFAVPSIYVFCRKSN